MGEEKTMGFDWKKISRIMVIIAAAAGVFAISACAGSGGGGRPDGYNPLVHPKYDAAMVK